MIITMNISVPSIKRMDAHEYSVFFQVMRNNSSANRSIVIIFRSQECSAKTILLIISSVECTAKCNLTTHGKTLEK